MKLRMDGTTNTAEYAAEACRDLVESLTRTEMNGGKISMPEDLKYLTEG